LDGAVMYANGPNGSDAVGHDLDAHVFSTANELFDVYVGVANSACCVGACCIQGCIEGIGQVRFFVNKQLPEVFAAHGGFDDNGVAKTIGVVLGVSQGVHRTFAPGHHWQASL
jgi:hypothetical protein